MKYIIETCKVREVRSGLFNQKRTTEEYGVCSSEVEASSEEEALTKLQNLLGSEVRVRSISTRRTPEKKAEQVSAQEKKDREQIRSRREKRVQDALKTLEQARSELEEAELELSKVDDDRYETVEIYCGCGCGGTTLKLKGGERYIETDCYSAYHVE